MHLSSKPLPSISGTRGGPILRIIGRRTGSFKGKPTGNKIQKCDTAFCWSEVTGAEGERLSGRSRNVKGSMLGRFSQQKKKSFFISLTFISGSYTHTHIQLHRHMHPSTRACRLWRWSTDALTHIQHTCEGPQKSGIRCDSQRNTWSNISAVNGCLIHPKKKKTGRHDGNTRPAQWVEKLL